jgi:hypothetical protein
VTILNSYVAKLHIAAERHAVVGRSFLSVANLMAPPPRLFSPRHPGPGAVVGAR